MDSGVWEQAVRRLLQSRTFRHRENSRRLLQYLATKVNASDPCDLKEYVIGLEALSKPETYDPQSDASVRVQVSRLRQSLREYYELEYPEDPVRVDIPKGQFHLAFEIRPKQDRAPAPGILERRVWRLTWTAAALATITICAVTALALFHGAHRHDKANPIGTPELIALWEPYINTDRPVLICLGAPLFAKYTTPDTGVFFRDPRINEWDAAEGSTDFSRIGAMLASERVTPSRIYTGVGEATGAFLLGRLLSHSRREVTLKRSHDASWEDFKTHNVIFLGSPKSNPRLLDLPFQQSFVFSGAAIQNLHPRQGEAGMFEHRFTAGHEELVEDHALISRFPGLHGAGETTILAGSSTEGTLAAVEFVAQRKYSAELVGRVRNPNGKMPRAYQVVIHARFKSQTPVEISYVTHRSLDASLTTVLRQKN